MGKGPQPHCFGLFNKKTSYCLYDCPWNKECKSQTAYIKDAKRRSRGKSPMSYEEYMHQNDVGTLGSKPTKRRRESIGETIRRSGADYWQQTGSHVYRRSHERKPKPKPKPKPRVKLMYMATEPMLAISFGLWKYKETLNQLDKDEMKKEFHNLKGYNPGDIRDMRMQAWRERYEQIVRG